MFKFMKEKIKDVELHAICNGEVIPIDAVPDKVFADKLMGDGVGFIFQNDRIYSPCDGEIVLVANTNHAIGIQAKNGAELLIHVGLDTVNLNGQGMKPKVKQGDQVKAGQELMQLDCAFMKEKNIDLTTPMILTSSEDFEIEIVKNHDHVVINDVIAKVKKR